MRTAKFFPPRPLSIGLLAALALLGGCAAVPDMGPAPQIKPLQPYQNTQSLPSEQGQWAAGQWWRKYGDAQLNKLMDEALSQAPDLAAARARVERAEGLAQQAGAARLPSADLNAAINRDKQSYNNGMPAPIGFNSSGRATLDFSYELDFWGKNRASVAAATSELTAARADSAQARLMLTTSLAAGYAELARLFAERDAAAQALDVRSHTAQLMSERQRQGMETLGSARQAESREAAARADLAAADENIVLQRHSLAALIGAGPDRGLAIARPAAGLFREQRLPDTLAAELLGRRPDLAAARLRAEAAAKRIDAAEAQFYPNVNLTAFVGAQSLGLGLFDKAGSGIAGVGPAINLPIFRGGQLQGQYRAARGDYDAAVASYDAALSQALRETADAVASQAALTPQLEQRRLALQTADEAYRVSQNRYQGGLANYLDVLNAEDGVIASRRSLAALDARRFALDVALIKALGGGYQQTEPQAAR
ncbi:efflux transporter outer membrane subunit [Chromobacterium subtsugae]|uniref:Efflux transporter outer membrane subunit n=1 Tax=Chromobacterium subtsugae TaxID=251747 RepID=A0ABS7FEB5_9NEIS|nr:MULTISPECIES: efflux transporter outer membrane subunit [Chromobacterium]KZE83685.1 multidrug transporter [Chromobacterium sp. F49]MBW7566725.1 efflux transporter outer membrane subunit [Chromobacterium subtsugae]MBW8288408.1 efflux transporter outer membrane subunit [Chromobacterium subtsugae]OBU87146.1 multidrug transporter [Chromobacterium subtsugae]WSE92301.1 efflux transporter outer membrane subunit [Chromobacterium subtsugae]